MTAVERHEPRQTRMGLVLFAVYLALYAAFVLLSAFAPEVMGTIVVAGLNLAIVYGVGLILAAFALAMLYAWLCRAGRTEARS